MPARAALFATLFTLPVSAAAAAPFEHLQADLAACLRFELDGAKSRRDAPASVRAGYALERCETEVNSLERADGRRVRGDGGLSPSTRAVLQTVLGRAERAPFTRARL